MSKVKMFGYMHVFCEMYRCHHPLNIPIFELADFALNSSSLRMLIKLAFAFFSRLICQVAKNSKRVSQTTRQSNEYY